MQSPPETTLNHASILETPDIDQLIRAHSRRLYNFVRRRIGNPADVDDLVQETYMEAVKCLDKFHGQSRPETWLFGIAMNLVRNYYKRARVHDVFDYSDTDEFLCATAEDPMAVAERQQTLMRLYQVLEQLPADTRLIFQLVFDDHCTYEEAAANLGIPVGTIRSRISRARTLLKDGITNPQKGQARKPVDMPSEPAHARSENDRFGQHPIDLAKRV